MRVIMASCLVCFSACNCDSGTLADGGGVIADSGVTRVDAGSVNPGPDAGQSDAGSSGTLDAGETADAGAPADAGFGPPSVCPAIADAGVSSCAAGTADCDNNPLDCETPIASDALNCGRCGRVCGATATCSAGLCQATLLMDPDVSSNYCSAIFSADRLFSITCWGNSDLSELRTAPIEPGSDVRGSSLIAYNNVSVVAMRGLTFDGPDVLFGLEGNPSRVFQVSATDGGPITTRFTTDAGTRFDSLQVVDDAYYWVHNRHTQPGTIVGASIKRRGRTDSNDTVLVDGLGLAYNVVVTPTRLLWVEAKSSGTPYGIYSAPRAGSNGDPANVKLVSATVSGAYLIRSGDFVYWTEKVSSPNGKLRRYEFAHTPPPWRKTSSPGSTARRASPLTVRTCTSSRLTPCTASECAEAAPSSSRRW